MIHPRTMDSICKTIATMKNLFKNLMLVAVAAMAFVACSQEGNEVNILTKETTFEFTAGFNEDTRSGFGEKEGDAYPSVWNGGESIIAIFSNEDGVIGTAHSSIDDLGEGVESSKTATFTVKYEGSLPDNYSVTFYSGSWYTNYETGEAYYYISDNQRCTDTSVESSNHLCKTEAIEVVNGEISTLNLTFNTATAFGKVTMEQFSDIADKIEEVKVTINDNTTYTVTPNALTKPVVWFACEAIESVTSLIVEAKVDGVTYIKTKEDIAEGALSFNTGRIRPINVKDMTEKPADYNIEFTKMVFEGEALNGGYLYTFTNESDSESMSLAFNPAYGNPLQAGTYECCFWFNSDNYDFNGNDSILIIDGENYYPTVGSKIIVELNESVYTIKANLVVGEKTAACTFTGEISEPEIPAFTSAKITNTEMYDKLVQFTSNELGTLQLNFYNCNYDNWIDARTYTFANSGEIYPGGSYSWYKDIDGTNHYAVDGTVVVTIVNGKYHIEFSNITDDEGSYTLNAVYEGEIDGLILPDLRTQLATPVFNTPTVNGKEITLTWSDVNGADGYYVYCDQDNTINTTTTELTATFTMPAYGTTYTFYIKAIANDDNPTYRSSDETYSYVSTGKDPNYVYEWTTAKARWFSTTNFTIEALSVDGRSLFYFDMYCPVASDKLLPEGTYTYGGDGYYIGYGMISTDVDNPSSGSWLLSGSTVIIKHLEDGYEFTINAVGDNNESMTTVYTGKVEDQNNSGVINPGDNTGGDNTGGETEFTPDYMIKSFSYTSFSTNYGTHRYDLTTDNNNLSFAIYIAQNQGSPLATGEYTYYNGSGDTNGDFTFSTRMFSPAPSSGNMVVSKDGDTYTVNLTLVVGTTTQKYQYIGTL